MALFLVTGGAGFIGSNIVRELINSGHSVRILDDFSTGHRSNLDNLTDSVEIIEGSICSDEVLRRAMHGVEFCLHEAALNSVPRSLNDPAATNRANVEGTLKVLLAAHAAGVKRVVCASSSSVYGNEKLLPTPEDSPLDPVSPYAVSKAAAEMYARVFADTLDLDVAVLRYFNVFGPYQDPNSQYAAVIPRFIARMMAGERPIVHGDGKQSRDFSFVENIVSANLLACAAPGPIRGVYNIACGETTTVGGLVDHLNAVLGTDLKPVYEPDRVGDVRESLADISRAARTFDYRPLRTVREGLEQTVAWYRTRAEQADRVV